MLRLPGPLSGISSRRRRTGSVRWPNMLIVVDEGLVIYSLTSGRAIVMLMPR